MKKSVCVDSQVLVLLSPLFDHLFLSVDAAKSLGISCCEKFATQYAAVCKFIIVDLV